jgi:pimeloyl-ACP methyl ester carboxylesterase
MTEHIPEHILQQARQLGRQLNQQARHDPEGAGRAAFRLFCTPRSPDTRSGHERFLTSAARRMVELEGLPICVYDWPAAQSDARRVLLLHGWESHSGRWYGLVPALRAAGFAVSALDAPGHGKSGGDWLNLQLYSRTVRAYCEQVETPYAMVGHSLGGAAVAVSMGLFGAPAVEKAVVLGAFAESHRVLVDFGGILGLEPPILEAVWREVERSSGHPIEAYSAVKTAAMLKGRVEALVLHDYDDVVSPVEEGRAIAEAWGARYIETRGLGHSMQGKEVQEAIVRFL